MSLYHVYSPQAGISKLVESDEGPEDAEARVRAVHSYQGVTSVSVIPTPESCCNKKATFLVEDKPGDKPEEKTQKAVEVVTKAAPKLAVEVVTPAPEKRSIFERFSAPENKQEAKPEEKQEETPEEKEEA